MMMITSPVFMPIVRLLDIDLIWFGVLFLTCMQLGLSFAAARPAAHDMKGVAPPEVTMNHIFRAAAPYIVMSVLLLALILGVPVIATYLPNKLG